MLHVAFLWHMHQPYYRDPLTGKYSLPWVRLHALKGYYDMVSILEDFPGIRQTFNLVPSLLCQIEDYAQGKGKDIFLEHSIKPAADLSPEEKKFILTNFFMCHRETMVKPYPRYFELLRQRGLRFPDSNWNEVLQHFSAQDYRDLQVWFNLTWFGYQARRKKESLRHLFKKGKGFTESDKVALLRAQREVLGEVIPLYRSARSRGQIEITASPFYHPILPLLIDWASASRAMPQVLLPGAFHQPEDAERQIQKAVAYHEKLFGSRPIGMWPSEGSVSPEIIPLAAKSGIRWIATDEGILFRSLPKPANRNRLFQPFRVVHQGRELSVVFRDRNLSDLIGFTYAKQSPPAAAADLCTHLKNIDRSLSGEKGDRLIVIALDGENPWEYYPDGGREFLARLYEQLADDPSLPTVKIGDFLAAHPPEDTLAHLHTGSWIDQNFRIWIGSPDDNRAWSYLKKTRSLLEKAPASTPSLTPEKRDLAWEEIYIAEGSDWFWWFGDDFHSDNDEEFDRLFRLHLSNVHLILGAEVPEYLKTPIRLPHPVKPTIEPVGLISPVIDGQVTHFYEWGEAGYIDGRPAQSSMYRGEGLIAGIYYGFDLNHLYFRLDPAARKSSHLPGLQYVIHFLHSKDCRILFPSHFAAGEPAFFLLGGTGEPNSVSSDRFPSIAIGKTIELSIPLSSLQFQPGEKVDFFVSIQKDRLELERYPNGGYISFTIPDQDFESMVWQV